METYQKLAALFESGESGVLSLPNFPAFIAKPVSLSYMTVTRPDILRYQFVFWEDSKILFQYLKSPGFVCMLR